MNRRTPEEARRIAESLGPAEKLVQLIINFPDHLWHNRPGVVRNGKWKAATRKEIEEHKTNCRLRNGEFGGFLPNILRVSSSLVASIQFFLADSKQVNWNISPRNAESF